MIDLHRYGQNPFSSRRLSVPGLSALTIEFLARATANPLGGQLDAEIAASATALEGFDVGITGETRTLGVQKARTGAKAEFRLALPNEISRLWGAVVSRFGQSAPEVLRCFPGGRTVFVRCADTLLDNHLAVLRDALTAMEAAAPGTFSAETLALAGALFTRWQELYGAATTGRSQRRQTASERRAAGHVLRAQLFKNLLKIALIFAGQVTARGKSLASDRIAHYLPQHLLEPRRAARAPQEEAPPQE